ncbi:MAG: VCBS repeat-containing protein [Candidatus Kerfeldbacteria bacterium]|nr:VCBS repeat-containing protein [Candidatus Kerfeldbacteria bacterium]
MVAIAVVAILAMASDAHAYQDATTFQFPLSKWSVGCNHFWGTCVSEHHLGEDVAAPAGTPVFACANGQVKEARLSADEQGYGYGGIVVIEHYTGTEHVTSITGHMYASTLAVSPGQEVHRGQLIGFVATYNYNGHWGEHVHFGIHKGSYQTGTSCAGGWVYAGYDANGCTQDNWYVPSEFIVGHAVEYRKENGLNDRNPYGWTQTPDQAFGDEATPAGALYEIGWYHYYNQENPANLYSADNTAKNCYRALYLNGPDDAAIVYDVLGGARRAYVVGWEKWQIWDQLEDDLDNLNPPKSCPTGDCYNSTSCDGPSGEGGPNSCLGMPLTNSYETAQGSGVWRQDFQKGYIQNGSIYCYTSCSPGWTDGEVWERQHSYLFADAYDRNGGARDVGNAVTSPAAAYGRVHTLSGNILIQDFSGGADGAGMIMYDQENWSGNECATNEAYWLYGSIKARYDANGGVSKFGCATTDRFQDDFDRWCQDFKSGDDLHRIFESGDPVFIALNPCDPNVIYYGAGGGMGGGQNDWCDLASVYDYTSYTRVHTWLSNTDGFNYQGDGGWWSNVEYPGDSVEHVMSGDFDGDSFDDIAVVQNKIISGTPKARVQVWLSTGGSFSFEDAWWAASGGYNALNVVHAEAGDFNGDGKCDVVLVYDYGYVVDRYQTRTHVLISTGSSFSLQSWWTSSGSYNAQNIRHCVAGDYTGDGKCDLVFFYDYGLVNGQYQFRSHVLVSSGTAFALQSWYTNTNYNINDVTQAVGGDFNDDGECDVAFAHADAATTTSLHVLQSTGSAFNYASWWTSPGSYGATNVAQAAAGDFDGDGLDDVMLAYAYSTVWVRFHMFLSTGSSFTMDHYSEGWWEATAYGITNHVRGIVAGNFNPALSAMGKRAVDDDAESLPISFSLSQNYPNPFNPVTNISYSLPNASHVTLEVFNILGQRVAKLVDGDLPAGDHTIVWEADKQASGIYFYRLRTEDAVETKKMLLLK